MRKTRIMQWVIAILLVVAFNLISAVISKSKDVSPKLNVYAPNKMKSAFNQAVHDAKIENINSLKVNLVKNKEDADIVVESNSDEKNEYVRIAYSPFIIVGDDSRDLLKQMIESDLLIPSVYDEDNLELNLIAIIKEVTEGEGKWTNLGIKDWSESIKVFYPSKSTIYWDKFVELMYFNINNGKYPISQEEIKSTKETFQKFINSQHTESVDNFSERLSRIGDYTKNCLWIVTEELQAELDDDYMNGRAFYPQYTVCMNWYARGNEKGSQVIDKGFKYDKVFSDFYSSLRDVGYRTENGGTRIYDLSATSSISNHFNVVEK